MHLLHLRDRPTGNSGVHTTNAPQGSLHSNSMHVPDRLHGTIVLLKTRLAKQIQLQRLQNQLLQREIQLLGGRNGNSFDLPRVKDYIFSSLLSSADDSKRSSPLILPINKRSQSPNPTLSRTTRSRASTVYSPYCPSSSSPPSSTQPNQGTKIVVSHPSHKAPISSGSSIPPPTPPQSQPQLSKPVIIGDVEPFPRACNPRVSNEHRSSVQSRPWPCSTASIRSGCYFWRHSYGRFHCYSDRLRTKRYERRQHVIHIPPINAHETKSGKREGRSVTRAKSSSSSAAFTSYLAPIRSASASPNGNSHAHRNPSARHATSPALKPILPGGLFPLILIWIGAIRLMASVTRLLR
ncbi:hypothetical protein BS47DRAFT_1397900 [Hydnum rufescens UP504]|uniref:Uncharacterized protein n=1 Tax=Hydnum rufescens UP504 TaxID=1448309 RepID=A0A9P6AMW0_9AGAM|nr:hypothetical protein BS47DRAFT_1397900 [Hydnum rufescens UP504]